MLLTSKIAIVEEAIVCAFINNLVKDIHTQKSKNTSLARNRG